MNEETLRTGDRPFLNGPALLDENRPILLLDIDGVISPLNTRNPENYNTIQATYPLDIMPQLPVYLKRFLNIVQPVWASTWADSANEEKVLLDHLGLDQLPWINLHADVDQDAVELDLLDPTRKLPWIHAFAEAFPDRPIIWWEDDAYEDAENWVEARKLNCPTLLISPERDIGITSAHLEETTDFLNIL